jgi:hypothetical protein
VSFSNTIKIAAQVQSRAQFEKLFFQFARETILNILVNNIHEKFKHLDNNNACKQTFSANVLLAHKLLYSCTYDFSIESLQKSIKKWKFTWLLSVAMMIFTASFPISALVLLIALQ